MAHLQHSWSWLLPLQCHHGVSSCAWMGAAPVTRAPPCRGIPAFMSAFGGRRSMPDMMEYIDMGGMGLIGMLHHEPRVDQQAAKAASCRGGSR